MISPRVCRLGCVLIAAAVTRLTWSQSVTTYHYDNYRTGWNSNETILTPAVVGGSNFGLLQSVPLDDQVDSQPLYMPAVNVTGGPDRGTHDVVYAATENNTLYAIDAESGTVLLSSNFGPPIPRPLGCNNNGPNVGINSTPVIDSTSNTLYVMVYTQQDNTPAYLLHALDLGSLTDKVAPQLVTASHPLADGSTFNFNATYQRQRPGLLLANGNVYAGFGSFCDYGPRFSRGWLLGWHAATLTPLAANHLFNALATSPNNFYLSSIWMSGYGPATDDAGNLLLVTGNSDPSGSTYDAENNISESVVKVSPDLSTVLDLFTPSDAPSLDQLDGDFGSGGVLVLPDQSGLYPHLAVAAGKAGWMYLMNEDALGGYSSSTNNVLGTYYIANCWCGPSYFVDPIDLAARVVSSGGTTVKVWKVVTSPTSSLSLVASSASIGGGAQDAGFFTSVSSNGTGNPIIWALSRPSTTDLSVYLYAFNPDSGTNMTTLFKGQAGTWPNLGGNANLVPVVANGKVFVASHQQLRIFGLKGQATTTGLTSSLNLSNFGQSVTFTVSLKSATGTPTGTVAFNDGTNTMGTATLVGGSGQFATSGLLPGKHSVTAVYSGDRTFDSSTSAILTQTVNQGVTATATTLTVTPNPSGYYQTVALQATVTSAIGVTPVGNVNFLQNGTTIIGTGGLNPAGTAALSMYTQGVGVHSLSATYAGSTNFAASTSSAVIETVNQAQTTTTLTSSANPSTGGQAMTFTATVTGQFGGSPGGTVTFKDGTTVIGSSTVSLTTRQAQLVTSTLSVGTHNITATYNGGTSFTASTSAILTQTVNQSVTATATTLTATPNPSGYYQTVALQATVTSAIGVTPVGNVNFLQNGTTIIGTAGLNPAGTATLSIHTQGVGVHSLSATYVGSTNFAASTSSAVSVTVNQAQTTTTLTSSANPSTGAQAVTFTATVTGQFVGSPGGTVTFKDGTTVIGSSAVSLTTRQAQLVTSTLSVGTHNITATYNGGTSFTASTSAIWTQIVN